MRKKSGLYASHHQFYIQDSEPRGTAGDPSFWTNEASETRLAVGNGLLAVGTGTYGFVKVRVEKHDSEPPMELSKWDHVTECGLEAKTRFLLIMGGLSQSGLFFEVQPRHYCVRACHANLAESEQEAPRTWTGEFHDWYLVQFWPGEPSQAKVFKRRVLAGGLGGLPD